MTWIIVKANLSVEVENKWVYLHLIQADKNTILCEGLSMEGTATNDI